MRQAKPILSMAPPWGLAGGQAISASSFDGVKGIRIKGRAKYTYLGAAASGPGDVNGDGYDDIALADRKYNLRDLWPPRGARAPGSFRNRQPYASGGNHPCAALVERHEPVFKRWSRVGRRRGRERGWNKRFIDRPFI